MRIYLSGPTEGIPSDYAAKFAAEAKRLRDLGYRVTNPAENNFEGYSYHAAKRRDIAQMMGCDAVVQLPGWEKVHGACLEYHCARELHMPVYRAGEVMPEPLALVGRAA